MIPPQPNAPFRPDAQSGDSVTEPAVVALARTAMASAVAALAAQDTATALRWLERAHRLVPRDTNAALTLATVCLPKDPARAVSLFTNVAERYPVRQAWLGIAATRLRLHQPEAAVEALAVALSRYAFVSDTLALARQVGAAHGWCALRSDGELEIHPAMPGQLRVTADGNPLDGSRLPVGWPRLHAAEVRIDGKHLLGSPIQISAIRHLAGCVEVCDGGIRGWAWHPNDPDTAPVLTVSDASGTVRQTFIACDESIIVPDTGPLARPRSFRLTRDELLHAACPIHIRGPDGLDLTGSPLNPFASAAGHIGAALRLGQSYPARPAHRGGTEVLDGQDRADKIGYPLFPADAPVLDYPIGAQARRRPMTVVIPVHNGVAVVLACLASVLASIGGVSSLEGTQVLVVDDGTSDVALVAALDDLGRQGKIAVMPASSCDHWRACGVGEAAVREPAMRPRPALGFPASANAGILAAGDRDVVLLNSDTLVPPGWLERLRDAAYAAADIGTVTPLSNDASIVSYPGPAGTNPRPDQAATNRLDRMAHRANGDAAVDIPVGVGFCLYLRRDCLNATDVFRGDVFAQGYGEENDLCLRARRLGWRNVALTGLFVAHHAGASFGGSAVHLRQRNARIVEALHPGYHALVDRFVAADPLRPARRRIDLLAWQQRGRTWRQAAILITHNDGGGVERRLMHSVDAHAASGRRPIVVRPAFTADKQPAIAIHDGLTDDLPNLIFAMPQELPVLMRLLRAAKADRVEAHHLADYPPSIYELIAQLNLPYEVHIHDYAWFCPRVSLVAAHNRYCGEPDLRDCEACIADNGHFLQEDIGVAELRCRSTVFLRQALRVVVPAADVGTRIRRYFPRLRPVVVPHEDDDAITCNQLPSSAPRFGQHAAGACRPSICVAGAIGVHKGYDVLLACARDAARRDLDLEFVVVGHTIDDTRMMQTGRVFVTGQFKPDESVELIAAQHARFAFVPSICPETWCLALGDLWRAGLRAAAFDIGAPAERIRRTGRGIILPLGLSASAINDVLIAAIRMA